MKRRPRCPLTASRDRATTIPARLADQLRFINEMVRVLGSYENVVVWNTWQEIGYWAEHLVGNTVCFCEHTLLGFRRWLTARFGDLDALNRAWNTRYAAWDAILPSRAAGARQPQAIDIHWQYFMDNVQVADVLRASVPQTKYLLIDDLKSYCTRLRGILIVHSASKFFKIFFANGSLISLCRGMASIIPVLGLIQSACELPSRFR